MIDFQKNRDPLLAKIVECMGDSEWIAWPNLSWLDLYFEKLFDLLNAISGGLFRAEFSTMQAFLIRFIALPDFAEAWANGTKFMKTFFKNRISKFLGNW